MAWVRFPDGPRRKVERVAKADAEAHLNASLALRSSGDAPDPRRERLAFFTEVVDRWLEAGCPTTAAGTRTRQAREKSPNTVLNAKQLCGRTCGRRSGVLWVDRTRTDRVEELFAKMAAAGLSTSTIDRTWGYLNQACQFALRKRRIKSNPVQDVLLPQVRPPKRRKSLTLDQANQIIFVALPEDPHPAMWLTGLMCGLRPGELAGLRWPYVDIDSDQSAIEVAERVNEVGQKYKGQTHPKTKCSCRRIGLHPFLVAALVQHREDLKLLGWYGDDGFVFPTSTAKPFRAQPAAIVPSALCSCWTGNQLDDVRVAALLCLTGCRSTR